ncbi:MAG: hypothetical protein ABTA24_01645 [Arthrobacter sp.]
MALIGAALPAQPQSMGRGTGRNAGVGALRRMDAAVFLTVWTLCVLASWDTSTKILLNVAAVALLCLKEAAVHIYLLRQSRTR